MPTYSSEIAAESSSTSEGFVSPAEIFQSFEADTRAAEELEARAAATAGGPRHERAAGHFFIGLITVYFEVVDISHPFFSAAYLGLRNRLVMGGCDLLVCATPPSQLGDPVCAVALARASRRAAADCRHAGGVDYPGVERIAGSAQALGKGPFPSIPRLITDER